MVLHNQDYGHGQMNIAVCAHGVARTAVDKVRHCVRGQVCDWLEGCVQVSDWLVECVQVSDWLADSRRYSATNEERSHDAARPVLCVTGHHHRSVLRQPS